MGGQGHKSYSPKQVKRIRERLGYTQSGFARKFGLARSTVSQWEAGKRPVEGVAAAFFICSKFTL